MNARPFVRRSAPSSNLVALLLAVMLIAVVVAAQPAVSLRLQSATVSAGQTVIALVRAPAGTTVVVSSDAPGVAPHTIVSTGAEQSVTLGPFISNGDYRVTASGGGTQATSALRVSFPQDSAPAAPALPASTIFASTADALLDTLNSARTGVSRLPQSEPTIAATKAAIDELQRQLAQIRSASSEIDATFDAVRRQLEKDESASREVKDEFARLEREIRQNLDEQARHMRDLGRDAAAPPVDSCAAAMAVSAALQGQRSTMNAMRGGVRQLQAGQARREAGASGADAAAWRQIKAKIEDLVRTGQSGSFAEAERSIGQATSSNGLGGYATRHCDKFTGEWSGTTYVEALEKGQPFYGLQNDWSARVEIAVARRAEDTADADRPLRGTLTGRAANFKVVNQLRTLYAGRPARLIEYLTTDPSPAQQDSATFVAAIEGFVRGNRMTLKIRPGGTDYNGRVTGKLAAVVIPMASPVPLVQTYDVVFQGGNWQLSRAIGPNGTPDRAFTITTGGDKRLVQERYPRTLNSTGARGQFTIDIRLCSGCDR